MNDVNVVTTRRPKSEIQCVRHVFSPHVGAKLPGDDVAAVIVEDGAEIEPAPSQNFDLGKVCLPELIDRCGFVFRLAGRLDDNESWAGDQIMCLEDPIRRSL